MPIEPPPTRWALIAPDRDAPDDLAAAGADLEPGTLLAAYRLGLFPMPLGDTIGWWSPSERAIVPLDPPRVSRSLRRAAASYEITVDRCFRDVVIGCADPSRPDGWIDDRVVDAYVRLHDLGWAHSFEAWDDGVLVGGLYGIAIGGLFAAESMFHRRTDASKAAFHALVTLLAASGDAGRRLFDCQWLTPHLASLGAVAITRGAYVEQLGMALAVDDPFS